MADHNLLIENISQRQSAEKLREGFVYSRILVLGLDFSLEAVDVVYLLCFMVSTGHVEKIDVGCLPGDKS